MGILPKNKTHVLKTWFLLETMKPTFRGGMEGGSNLFTLFRTAHTRSNYYDVDVSTQHTIHTTNQLETSGLIRSTINFLDGALLDY